jgi:hypothetical protein
VTIKYIDVNEASKANSKEASWIAEMWPDQERYRREEQRRFEILIAHWDIPIKQINSSQ